MDSEFSQSEWHVTPAKHKPHLENTFKKKTFFLFHMPNIVLQTMFILKVLETNIFKVPM